MALDYEDPQDVQDDDDGRPPKGRLPTSVIHIDHSYQRPLDINRVARMRRDGFDWDLFGVISVNQRDDGRWYAFDGQQRLELARLCGKKTVDVVFHFGKTKNEEALDFEKLNGSQKPVPYLGRFRSRIEREDPVAIAIRDALVREGFELSINGTKGGRRIVASAALDQLYRSGGAEHIQHVLRIVNGAWYESEHQATNSELLKAIGQFLTAHVPRDTNDAELIAKLKLVSPRTVLNLAREKAYLKNRSDSTPNKYEVLLELANKRRKLKIPVRPGNLILRVLTDDEVREVRALAAQGMTHRALAKRFGVAQSLITDTINRKMYKHVE